jgi:hypothetical protein
MLSIQGLEIDYLRAELKRVKGLHRLHEEVLAETIYEFLMANFDLGMGDAATTMDESINIVKEWKERIKELEKTQKP